MKRPWCVALEEVRRGDVAQAGGKAANLGELLHAGFAVPSGFVVTTGAHRSAMESVPPGVAVEDATVPEGVAVDIRDFYARMGGGPVAIRSSATAEDLPGAAFAGQQDTYLNIIGSDDVVAAVRDCWASLFSERAVAYRDRLGIHPDTVAMAVVVQRMVPAEVAGVMFTAHPVTGARDVVVIDSSRGLGESVVSGLVTPDHVVVNGRGRIVERRLGGAGIVIEADDGGGTLQREQSFDSPALTDGQVVRLAAIGRRIEAHFARPQDIEWAIHAGHLAILQARAVTALPPPPIRLNRFQRFIGPTLIEMLPRRPYPMELTAWIIPTVARHVVEMMEQLVGVRISWEDMLPATDAIVQEFVPPSPRPTTATPRRLAKTLVRGLRVGPEQWRNSPLLESYRAGAAHLDHLDPHLLSPTQLVAVPQRATELMVMMTHLRVEHLARALVGILGLRLALMGRTSVLPELIGNVPTMTRAANDELAALAEAARAIPELGELISEGDLTAVVGLASSLPAAAGWWSRFQHFLATYGHRETTSVMLVHDPAWVDAPITVLGMIRVLMGKTSPGEEHWRLPPVDSAARSPLVRRLGRRAAEGVAFREDTHFELTRTGPAVRRAINEVGRRLVEEALLDGAEDVWFLTLDEVASWAAAPTTDAAGQDRLRDSAARRRTAWTEMAATPLIATTTLYPRRHGSAGALVTGASGGGGRATGPVRVVGGPADFATLRAGEVLVCSATNPSWTPLFQRAAAVVVDHGGVASHAAIVALEYGIPAVMGAATATTLLRDGQWVMVDGDRGEVVAAVERP
ncbi:MAG: PEP/pyruvate-binding domain-containing protein [Propionibacteriaceae bacterium]|nr:PEP/pyruvate-binding domain-containing protein [Propionibacteriaceae bacterium]